MRLLSGFFLLSHPVLLRRYEKSETVRKTLNGRITSYLDRAEHLKKLVQSDEPAVAPPAEDGGGGGGAAGSGKSSSAADTVQKQEQALKDQIMESVLHEKPNVPWDAVAGLEGVKETLKQAVVYPLKMSHLVCASLVRLVRLHADCTHREDHSSAH